MRIEAPSANSEYGSRLQARWWAAEEKWRTLSKTAQFDLARRRNRLNVLLFELEQHHAGRNYSISEANRAQRSAYWWLGAGAVVFVATWTLDALSIWSPYPGSDYVLLAAFFGNALLHLFSKARLRAHADETWLNIAIATTEFWELSNFSIPYSDLALLDENWRETTGFDNVEDALEGADTRRAELQVNVMENLVRTVAGIDADGD